MNAVWCTIYSRTYDAERGRFGIFKDLQIESLEATWKLVRQYSLKVQNRLFAHIKRAF